MYPVVDLGSQLTDLVQAQTSYQANAKVMADCQDRLRSHTQYQGLTMIPAILPIPSIGAAQAAGAGVAPGAATGAGTVPRPRFRTCSVRRSTR